MHAAGQQQSRRRQQERPPAPPANPPTLVCRLQFQRRVPLVSAAQPGLIGPHHRVWSVVGGVVHHLHQLTGGPIVPRPGRPVGPCSQEGQAKQAKQQCRRVSDQRTGSQTSGTDTVLAVQCQIPCLLWL